MMAVLGKKKYLFLSLHMMHTFESLSCFFVATQHDIAVKKLIKSYCSQQTIFSSFYLRCKHLKV